MKDSEYAKYLFTLLINSGEDCCSMCSYCKEGELCKNLVENTEKINNDICFEGLKLFAEQPINFDVYFQTNELPFRETHVTLSAPTHTYFSYVKEGYEEWDKIPESDWKRQVHKTAFELLKNSRYDTNDWHIITLELVDEEEKAEKKALSWKSNKIDRR